jgi:hypothetical protein
MASDIPPQVLAVAEDLPDVFAPLRAASSGAEALNGLVPLLELPPASTAPALLQWLPRARSSVGLDP